MLAGAGERMADIRRNGPILALFRQPGIAASLIFLPHRTPVRSQTRFRKAGALRGEQALQLVQYISPAVSVASPVERASPGGRPSSNMLLAVELHTVFRLLDP